MVLNNGYNDSLIGRSFNISATTENADERILVIEVILCGTACRRYSEFCVGTSADAAMSLERHNADTWRIICECDNQETADYLYGYFIYKGMRQSTIGDSGKAIYIYKVWPTTVE